MVNLPYGLDLIISKTLVIDVNLIHQEDCYLAALLLSQEQRFCRGDVGLVGCGNMKSCNRVDNTHPDTLAWTFTSAP